MTKDEVINLARKSVSTWGTSDHHIAMHNLNLAFIEFDKEWPEQRQDIVGQNGNDGVHYCGLSFDGDEKE